MDSDSRLAAAEAERDALLENDVRSWLAVALKQSALQADYQNSLSWRITQPLRLVRSYQLRLRQDGFASANAQAVAVLKKRLRRR